MPRVSYHWRMPSLLITIAQAGSAPTTTANFEAIRKLFVQSFDFFTIVLLIGSVAAGAVIVRCILEIRSKVILPKEPEERIRELIAEGRVEELEGYVSRDPAFVSRVVKAALDAPRTDKVAMRDAAELAASEQSSSWFRKVEPLNVIGNLGPLLGLAGTVWGMVLAFSVLGEKGGQADPAALSEGIAKALFHTLLGLMLAVPALTVFGFYRQTVDRLCTRAMIVSAELVESLLTKIDASGNAVRTSRFTPAASLPKLEPAASGAER